jgi:hypothetical protein
MKTMSTGMLAALLAAVAGTTVAATPQTVLLNEGSFWRCRYAWGTELVERTSGELVSVHPEQPTDPTIWRRRRQKVRKLFERIRALTPDQKAALRALLGK